jgi:hypothetical protein
MGGWADGLVPPYLPSPAGRWSSSGPLVHAPPANCMPTTDYIRHAARLARKIHMDAAMGGAPQPDAEFFKTLSKAFDEIAAGLEQVAKRE